MCKAECLGPVSICVSIWDHKYLWKAECFYLYIVHQANVKMILNHLQTILNWILTQLLLVITAVLGDFNAKPNLWFKGDKAMYEGSKIDGISSTFGLQ